MAASATLALKAGVWFRRGRLFIVSPDSLAQRARCQAETPLIVLFRFLRPALTVQLIDAETDRHIWAERYDRELEDIFAIQDEMTRAIVATLPGRVEAATQDRAKRKTTDNMAAYECVLAAKVLHHRSTREDNAEAQRLLDRALALDPNYAHAHAWKACVLGQTWVY